jgi:hypothetical protein
MRLVVLESFVAKQFRPAKITFIHRPSSHKVKMCNEKVDQVAPVSTMETVRACKRCGYQVVVGDQCGNCGIAN